MEKKLQLFKSFDPRFIASKIKGAQFFILLSVYIFIFFKRSQVLLFRLESQKTQTEPIFLFLINPNAGQVP